MPRFVIITWINNQLFFLKEFPSDGPIVTTRNPAQARVFEMLNVCQLTHAWLAQNHPAVWHWALYDAVERRTTKDDSPLTTKC